MNQNLYLWIKISENRVWRLNYNLVCGIFFLPLTTYGSLKIRKIRISRRKRLERERKLKKLEKFYRILKVTGSSISSLVLLKILRLRAGGTDIIVPGIDDCVDLESPSYVNDERILRFLNDRYKKLAINGIIYITKEAFCYLVKREGLVDFPLVFLERVKIDGIYSFLKSASEWGVFSIAAMVVFNGFMAPQYAAVYFGYIWLHIHSLNILTPQVKEVNKLTGRYVPRIDTRKDAIVFDPQKEPLPPAIEDSLKPNASPNRIETLDTQYEIGDDRLVDVQTVTGLNNRFSDRVVKRRRRRTPKKPGKTVRFLDMLETWKKQDEADGADGADGGIIDRLLEDGII